MSRHFDRFGAPMLGNNRVLIGALVALVVVAGIVVLGSSRPLPQDEATRLFTGFTASPLARKQPDHDRVVELEEEVDELRSKLLTVQTERRVALALGEEVEELEEEVDELEELVDELDEEIEELRKAGAVTLPR